MHHQSAQHIDHHNKALIDRSLIDALQCEADLLQTLINNLPANAALLVTELLSLNGKVIFSGLGKSGSVSRKLAATFSSTGTPALFMHPSDALHGDLGVIQKNDIFIALSKSGSGEEFEHIFSFLHTQNTKSVLICCSPGTLEKKADLVIQLPVGPEACHLNLAPTSSSTLMMAFGDAIAVTTGKLRGFKKNDFARLHPAGIIGRKLLLTIADIMHSGDKLPLINPETSFKDIIITITQKKLGVGIITDNQQSLLGIITDGDLRRACNHGITVFEKKADEIMTHQPKSIFSTMLAHDALNYMEQANITTLVVVDNQKVVGLVHIHDLIKIGL